MSGALAVGALVVVLLPVAPARAQTPRAAASAAAPDGGHDFDFETGAWVMRRRRLLHPLTGDTTWVDPGPARHLVRKIWGGGASLAELELDSPSPHFAGSLLHLYDPQSGQWRLYWASAGDGTVSGPMVGSFRGGRGVFEDEEPYHGRTIRVRVVYSDITPASFRTEQAFSADSGRTWQTNAVDLYARAGDSVTARDGGHDFDWDIGTWKTHQRRLLRPLTGSTAWVDYEGTDVVRRLWDGANQGIIEADGPAGHLEIFTLRLYDPDARQWSVYFTSPGGTLSKPVVGEFKDGRGEFYDQEPYRGREILVRFAVSGIAADTCHFEQAFSADGGRTWETNFVVSEARVR